MSYLFSFIREETMISYIQKRWSAPNGYREILTIAFPLILSTGSWSIQQFVDRMFLSWYSEDSLAAAMPAGILNFSFICVFIGTVSYAGTFVSQYTGAKEDRRIGRVLSHSLYLSFIGALMMLLIAPFSPHIFRLIGHDASLQPLETTYFRILSFGALGPILSAAFAGFFTGQGRTWPVMWINIITTAINLILDYLFIFGVGPIEPMGIKGAAIATIIAGFSSIIMYMVLIYTPENRSRFAIDTSWLPDFTFLKRFLHFGLPSGMHFFLEIMGFTGFILILGRLGTEELAATNIAININSMAFMPMLGLGITVSMLVGQNIGSGNPDKAHYATNSAVQLGTAYMVFCALLYILIPKLFIAPFDATESVANTTIILLRFVAFYALFDTCSILYSHAIKGAGDTHFVMRITTYLSLFVLIIPTFFAVVVYETNLFFPWAFCATFIFSMGMIFLFRFRQGKWKKMSVIEEKEGIPSQHPSAVVNE